MSKPAAACRNEVKRMHSRHRIHLVPLIALLAGCQSVAPATQHAPSTTAAVPAVAIHPLRDGLYASGQPASNDWSGIAARGVRTVVNLRPTAEMAGRDEAAEVQAAGMHYVSIPVANAAAITPEAARALESVLRGADGPVLVHCHTGNRAGGLIAVTAAQQEGVPAQQAIELGRRGGMQSTEARVRQLLGVPAQDQAPAPH